MKGYALHCGDIQLKKQQNTTIIPAPWAGLWWYFVQKQEKPTQTANAPRKRRVGDCCAFSLLFHEMQGVALAFSWKTKKKRSESANAPQMLQLQKPKI